MSSDLKDSTRTPADRKLHAMLKREVKARFPDLKGANFFVVLVANKLDDWLGVIKKTDETTWLATGGAAEGSGVDFLMELNESIYDKAGENARRGMLGILLARAHAKNTGKTRQSHGNGERQLYGVSNPTLGVDPATVEKYPEIIEAFPILRYLQLAFEPGHQYALHLEAEESKLAEIGDLEKAA